MFDLKCEIAIFCVTVILFSLVLLVYSNFRVFSLCLNRICIMKIHHNDYVCIYYYLRFFETNHELKIMVYNVLSKKKLAVNREQFILPYKEDNSKDNIRNCGSKDSLYHLNKTPWFSLLQLFNFVYVRIR